MRLSCAHVDILRQTHFRSAEKRPRSFHAKEGQKVFEIQELFVEQWRSLTELPQAQVQLSRMWQVAMVWCVQCTRNEVTSMHMA